jgi:hypothetical protein
VGVLLGNGDGTFQTATTYNSGGFYATSVAVADINGDGNPDLVVASQCGSSNCSNAKGMLEVLLGNGDGTFQTATTYSSGGLGATSVVVGDVNGDGNPDVLVSNMCANSINNLCPDSNSSVGVLLGNGNGTFQPVVTYDSGGYNAYSITVADVNGDGKPDLVVAKSVYEK